MLCVCVCVCVWMGSCSSFTTCSVSQGLLRWDGGEIISGLSCEELGLELRLRNGLGKSNILGQLVKQMIAFQHAGEF